MARTAVLLSLGRAPALPPQSAHFGSQSHTPYNRCLRFGPRVTATPARLAPVLLARLWTDQTCTGKLTPASPIAPRLQLSRRRCPLSGYGRYQPNKVDKPELAVKPATRQRFPAAAPPLLEPMRPDAPHQPTVEPVEELSDVSPLVVVAPATHDGIDLFYQFRGAYRSLPSRQPPNLIHEASDRLPPR